MPNDNDPIDPEEATSEIKLGREANENQAEGAQPLDPNDEIPVPVAMEPAEIDERAQVVEALRAKNATRSDDDSRMEA